MPSRLINLKPVPAIRSLPEELPVAAEFRDPPPGYGPVPFWFWNARIEEDEVRRQIREMQEKGCSGAFLHARHGLRTPYMSDEWLRLVQAAADESAACGFQLWLYDEDNWPSGTAGGAVTATHPEYRARYLQSVSVPVEKEPVSLPIKGELLGAWAFPVDRDGRPAGEPVRVMPSAARSGAVHCPSRDRGPGANGAMNCPTTNGAYAADGAANCPTTNGSVSFEPREGETWRLLLFTSRDGGYVDVMNPDATALFLRLTHDRYAEAVGEHFGRTVPGIFMDEATLLSFWDVSDPRGLPWSALLPDAFRLRHGYDILEHLPALAEPLPGAARVRCDYYATLSELYVDAFFRPIQEWCADHGIASTGHVLQEEPLAPQVRHQADAPAAYRCFDIPGVDNLTVRTGGIHHRLAASIAHQRTGDGRWETGDPPAGPRSHVAGLPDAGRPPARPSPVSRPPSRRVLSETYGAAGWGATLAQRKASADWQLANGINFFVPHAVFYTVYGKRKRENPPSEFEQEPFWVHYRHFADYLARLDFLLTRGKHAARVALLYPLRSAWVHYHPGYQPPGSDEQARTAFAGPGAPDRLLLGRIERDLYDLCELLAALHFDFDLVDEAGLLGARIEKSRLCLGPERYELLVLPSMTTCTRRAWARMREFFDAGGNILACGLLPYQTGEGDAEDEALRREVRELTTLDPTAPERPGGATARAMGRDAMQPLQVNRVHGSRVARYLPARVPVVQQRHLLMKTLLRTLTAIDVDLDCPEIICHCRDTVDGKLFFLVNASDQPRQVAATFYAVGHPEEWDAESGGVRRLWEYARAGEKVTMPLRFGPRQARAISFTGDDPVRAERANFEVTNIVTEEDHYLVEGIARDHDQPLETPPNCSLAWNGGGRWAEGIDKGLLVPIELGEVWDLRVLGDNYLVLEEWRTHVPRPGQDPETLATFQEHWPELPKREPITWFPNLEPLERERPDEAWFQTRFRLDSVPRTLSLLLEPLDIPYTVLVNGREVMPLQTGVLDPRFLTADVADVAVEGENVVAIRLSYAGVEAPHPDNLHRITCDLVPEPARLLGDFTALPEEDGGYLLYAGAPEQIGTGSWAEQGFPHYSGVLEYSQPVMVMPDYFEFKLMLLCERPADIVEVLVNGKPAGVRLWPPYAVDVSEHLFAGTNQITLRVSNGAANALLGQTRPSGLLGPVRIEAHACFTVKVPR